MCGTNMNTPSDVTSVHHHSVIDKFTFGWTKTCGEHVSTTKWCRKPASSFVISRANVEKNVSKQNWWIVCHRSIAWKFTAKCDIFRWKRSTFYVSTFMCNVWHTHLKSLKIHSTEQDYPQLCRFLYCYQKKKSLDIRTYFGWSSVPDRDIQIFFILTTTYMHLHSHGFVKAICYMSIPHDKTVYSVLWLFNQILKQILVRLHKIKLQDNEWLKYE